MKSAFDYMLGDLFAGTGPTINLVGGMVVFVIGVVLLFSAQKRPSKGKSTAVWICIGVWLPWGFQRWGTVVVLFILGAI